MLKSTLGENLVYDSGDRPNPAKFATLKEDLMNGKGSKFLLTVCSALLVGAIYASYTASGRLASIETKLNSLIQNQIELKARILYLERERVRDNRQWNRENPK